MECDRVECLYGFLPFKKGFVCGGSKVEVGYIPVFSQRRNARVNRVTFNERLNILVLGS